MFDAQGRTFRETGFTLLEVLVTVLILGLLAAVVFPIVIPQLGKADPTKASNDLANLRTGIEMFMLDVRPDEPGDLEDLVQSINAGDLNLADQTYKNTLSWDGPYVDISLASSTVATGDTALTTGFGSPILSDLYRYDSTQGAGSNTSSEPAAASADFLALRILNLTVEEFEDLNDQIDGEGESSSQTQGKLRFDPGTQDVDGDAGTGVGAGGNDTVTYFLGVPFKN